MRNLKRVLSLTLASVMLLGMMVVSSSAASTSDFTDASEITYTEGVDVMSALEVLQGTDKGAFNPTGILTREQAAKIICYMLMGAENAEKLAGTAGIFTDVASNRWSAPFIGYCVNLGILAGQGNGTFAPEGELTGLAFGKMLLVALGYDATIEEYVGANWSTNVAADMVEAGLSVKGVTLSNPLTREEAAQMALQCLEADMVKYSSKGTTVIGADGMQVIIGSTPAEKVAKTDSDYRGDDANGDPYDEYQQFVEKYFEDVTRVTLGGDDFGRPAYTWDNDGEEIDTYSDSPKHTLKNAYTGKALYNTVGKTAVTDSDYNWGVYVDGEAVDADAFRDFAADKDTDDVAVSGNGVVTEIYVDKKNVTVCVINTYAGEVDKVYTKDDVDSDEEPYVVVDGLEFETVSFDEEDIVYYTKSIDGSDEKIQSMGLAEEVEGEVSKVTTGKNFTLDGTTYKYSKKFDSADKLTTENVKNDAVVYLDGAGFVIYKGEASSSNDFAYVISMGREVDRFNNTKYTFYAKLLMTDGTVVSVELDEDYANLGAAETALKNKVVSYTVDDDDIYDLSAKGNALYATDSTFEIEQGKSRIISANGNAYANSNTVFLVADDVDDDEYDVYVGIKNVPDISGGRAAIFSKDGIAKVVYVQDADVESASSSDVFFIVGKTNPDSADGGDGLYYEFKAIAEDENGKLASTSIKVAEGNTTLLATLKAENNKIFAAKSLTKNSKGFTTKINAFDAEDVQEFVGTKKESNDLLGFNYDSGEDEYTTFYSFKDDAVVAKLDGKTLGKPEGISSVKSDENDRAIVVLDKGVIIGVFVTVVK